MTSSLQIEASRKLRFDPERTMRAAQRLYENGWITYMRTDSTTLSDEAIRAARRPRPRCSVTTTWLSPRVATTAR